MQQLSSRLPGSVLLLLLFLSLQVPMVYAQETVLETSTEPMPASVSRDAIADLNTRAVARMQQNTFEARQMAVEARNLAAENGHDSLLMVSEKNLGLILFYEGNYQASLLAFLEAKQLATAQRHDSALVDLTGDIAMVYAALGDLQKAELYYEMAILLAGKRSNQEPRKLARYLISAAVLNRQTGKPDRALEQLDQADSLVRSISFDEGRAQVWTNRAHVYLDLGRFREADSLYLKALTVSERTGSVSGQTAAFLSLGMLYMKRNNCHGAKQMMERGLPLAQAAQMRPQLQQYYFQLMKAAECTGDFHTAYVWQNRHRMLSDSLDSEARLRLASQTARPFRLEQATSRDAVLEELAEVSGRIRVLYGVIALLAALLAAVTTALLRARRTAA